MNSARDASLRVDSSSEECGSFNSIHQRSNGITMVRSFMPMLRVYAVKDSKLVKVFPNLMLAKAVHVKLVPTVWPARCGSEVLNYLRLDSLRISGSGERKSSCSSVVGCFKTKRFAWSQYPASPGNPGSIDLGFPPEAYSGSPTNG